GVAGGRPGPGRDPRIDGEPRRGRLLLGRPGHPEARARGGPRPPLHPPHGRRLSAALEGPSGIAVFDAAAHRSLLEARGPAADLAVNAQGTVWMTDSLRRRVAFGDALPRPMAALENAEAAGTLALSPDQSLLAVADPDGRAVWSYRTDADGMLQDGQPFFRVEAPEGATPALGGM